MNGIIIVCIISTIALSLYGRPMGKVSQSGVLLQNQPTPLPVTTELKQNAIKKLDALLDVQNIDEEWYTRVNDIMFDLASLDKNLSNAYVKKIFIKTSANPIKKSSVNIVDRPAQKYSNSSSASSQELVSEKKDTTTAKNAVIQKIENILQQQVFTDEWYIAANNLVIDLALLDREASNNYFKKILDKITQAALSSVEQKLPVELSSQNVAEKDDLIKKLNTALDQENITDEWYAQVDDLIFDLAVIDRNLSNEYLKKIRVKEWANKKPLSLADQSSAINPTDEKSTIGSAGGMQKGTPPPPPGGGMVKGTPPPSPGGGMVKGTPPAAPGGAMAKGTPPSAPGAPMIKKGPPPSPGPMVKGKKPAETTANKGPVAPIAGKGPQLLSVNESYSMRQLEKRSNEEIIQLFNSLLEALGSMKSCWDEVKKKPTLDWENKISTIKKALLDPKRAIKMEIDKLIAERIVQVKAQKEKEGQEKLAAAGKKVEQKEQEEFSEKELIARIEALKKKADISDFKWLIEFQGMVKKLDKINHQKAVEYQNDFLKKFPDQKSFLPKPKAQIEEKKKELTLVEKQMLLIDTILTDKPNFWAIKVREPIEELYDIDSQRGLEYQDKYLAEAKKVSGKEEKPFLKDKK